MTVNYYASAVISLSTIILFLVTRSVVIPPILGQLPVPSVRANPPALAGSNTTSSSASITIHTTNTIQTNNFNVTRDLAALRKIVQSDMGNAISIAKGSVKSTIPVSVNASIINQLANNRKDTTQGVDMTKHIVSTELANARSTLLPNANTTSKNNEQASKVVIDSQAVCSGIASPSIPGCAFTITMHR